MEWLGANPQPEIIAEDITSDYHIYGLLKEKAKGFKRITYKDLYPGIDMIYHFNNSGKTGFEYSLIVRSGADLSMVKMKYGGDVKRIAINKNGNLVIQSAINEIAETSPLSFSSTTDKLQLKPDVQSKQYIYSSSFQKNNNIISFTISDYDKAKPLVVDPFISNTANLTGANNGIAKDIDFDYDGNIYVVGGGGSGFLPCKLAKFDPTGVLLWTFHGTLTTPSWIFGITNGGWVVEKTTGNIYLGQGLGVPNGSVNIRLNTAGIYDNFITVADINFSENWKMAWNCNNGNPQIFIAGGSNNSNNNLAICTPPSPIITGANITGNSAFNQDISDFVFDPTTNDMYTIYASDITPPFISNRIYKHKPPYGVSDVLWQTPSGFNRLFEQSNRPYLATNTFGFTDNSTNALSVNSSYLFYYDGLNLKAFSKVDGTTVGTPLVLNPNVALMQGGIVADECNNVFIGSTNGTIKVYKFNGSIFDDAAANDINIASYPTASVYDLAYDQGRQLLYASGNGFVASIDISSYCATTVYTLSVISDCNTVSAQSSVSPAPPAATVITYILMSGATQIATNTTGLFTGLNPVLTYTVRAIINQACGGIQLIKDFNFTSCPLSITATFINPSCNLSNGSITASATFGTPPYQFSKDGIVFQTSGNFSGLAAGNYTITVRDALNVTNTINVLLVNSPPVLLNATATASTCNFNNGVITATGSGGSAPLQYSIDGINFQVSNIFTGLSPNNYTVTVKDFNNCSATFPVTVTLNNTLTVNAGNNITICEGTKTTLNATSNGTSFSWSPVTGLNNPAILNPEASPIVTTPYTLTATNGTCTATSMVTVFVNLAPIAYAGRDTGICFGKDILLTGTGGASYLWKPSTYLSNANVFNPMVIQPSVGLLTYSLSVIGANGCNSLKDDVVLLTVSPPPNLFAGNDTTVAINQPLQLFGVDINNTGFNNYTWSPNYGLNNPFIINPVAILNRDITYSLTAQNANGCIGVDNIKITVFEGPEIYVPNAFTPNSDGKNDILKAIPIGLKEFKYFTIFNTYGQLVFTTKDPAIGWDGNFKGAKQGLGTYVWIAEGVNYKGTQLQRKGTVILIR
ncbi:MAG: gliding motility-associated C-terminal domain-containing protein [Chitinophagaceae bacterium]|nr:gliding motility-associated C-terminal domain-containing protein [Chitinophagaceae bacterium]